MNFWRDFLRHDISHWSTTGKLAFWFGGTAAIVAVAQVLAWPFFGWEWNAFQSKGVILATALGLLLGVMGRDRRPLEDYGLLVADDWRKVFFGAVALGGSIVGLGLLASWWGGALQITGQPVSWSRLGKAVLAGMSSAPVAAVQQVIFSGYLLTILRQGRSRVTAVLACGLLFAVLGKLNDPAAILRPPTQQVMLGLFSVGVLLAALRCWTGSIVYPAGLLAGMICVRRVVDKLRLFEPTETVAASWLFPQNDLRCSPVVWMLLLAATGVLLWRLHRRGDKRLQVDGAALAADFKATFPLSNTISLAPLDVWLARIWDARGRIGLAYVPRLIAILALSGANTLLTLPERLLMPWLLRGRQIRQPVFIVGVHRSGTTHLHNLLSLDPQFTAPTTHHIMNPAGCVFSGWIVSPVLSLFLPYERPMDSVRFSMFSPQEDEFGVCGWSRCSAYWGMSFPQHWPHYDQYLFPQKLPAAERSRWRKCYDFFLKQVMFWSRKRALLKNPCNTGRVGELLAMYPDAKVIHIYRHPDAVYRSNMRLASDGHATFQVQDQRTDEHSYQQRFLRNYRDMEDAYYEAVAAAPEGACGEVRFEDLEADPVREIMRLYRELDLDCSPEFLRKLHDYLDTLKDYSKNSYRPLDPVVTAEIDRRMGPRMRQWGYHRDQQRAA